MTTTVAFATRECIVLGCDSLGTLLAPMVDPFALLVDFFEQDKKGTWRLKTTKAGKPMLKDFGQIFARSERIPVNQLPTMSKLFSLEPAKAGVLFAGASVIGNMSVKEHIVHFANNSEAVRAPVYTIEEITSELSDYLTGVFDDVKKETGSEFITNQLELTIAGYSTAETKAEIFKIYFNASGQGQVIPYVRPGEYNVIFGRQYDISHRVVNGIDPTNIENYKRHLKQVVTTYRDIVKERNAAAELDLPDYDDVETDLVGTDPVSWVSRSAVDLANFSEQAAIDFVDFLIQVMIKAQHFSDRLQTVGGNVHIALLTKSEGLRMISREEYVHDGHSVPKALNGPPLP